MTTILGIDLAWGERNPDGFAVLAVPPGRANPEFIEIGLCHGDAGLMAEIERRTRQGSVIAAIDAPIICPNESGARPVDRLTHVHFGRQHAGCHPANLSLCPRPPRIGRALQMAGFELTPELNWGRVAFEVYPHTAILRFFRLPSIIRYKRGPARRTEFARLQQLVGGHLADHRIDAGPAAGALQSRWSKPVEDQVDAVICALVGYHHVLHHGAKSQILGDRETGFIVIPDPEREVVRSATGCPSRPLC